VKTHTFVGDRPSNITNAKKIARTAGGFSPRVSAARLGAAYTRLEPDDECDEANLTAVLLHPWKASSGGNRGRCREGVTHGFLLLPWGNRNGGTVGVVLGRRLETPGAIWELRVEQSWGLQGNPAARSYIAGRGSRAKTSRHGEGTTELVGVMGIGSCCACSDSKLPAGWRTSRELHG
jgi:hypothetical protein